MNIGKRRKFYKERERKNNYKRLTKTLNLPDQITFHLRLNITLAKLLCRNAIGQNYFHDKQQLGGYIRP